MSQEVELDDPKLCVTIRHPLPVPRKFKQFRRDIWFGKNLLDENTLIDSNSEKKSGRRQSKAGLGAAFLALLMIGFVWGSFNYNPYIVNYEFYQSTAYVVIMTMLGLSAVGVGLVVSTVSPGFCNRFFKGNQLRVADVLA